jgi:hypothetical protein
MDADLSSKLLSIFRNPTELYPWVSIASKMLSNHNYGQASELLLKIYDQKDVVNSFTKQQKFDLYYTMMLTLFYVNKLKEGLEVGDTLYLNKPIPALHEGISRNLRFYIQPLKIKEEVDINIKRPVLDNGELWNSTNPSIVNVKEVNQELFGDKVKFMLNSRTINYKEENCVWSSREKDGIVRTRNQVVLYDENFKVVSQHEMLENYFKVKPNNITGLEDCRITMKSNGEVFFTTVTFDNHHFPAPKISIGTYNTKAVKESSFKVEALKVFSGPDINRCEKNWCPFIYNSTTKKIDPSGDKLLVIYSYSPLVVYEVNYLNGSLSEYKELCDYTSTMFTSFRGSGGPVPFDGGALCVIHDVIFIPQNNTYVRNYVHRLVWLNEEFKIKKVSHPFYFKNLRIEYCCGMCRDGDDVVITVGMEEKASKIFRVDGRVIREMLHEVILM